jgi:hypothetical protein
VEQENDADDEGGQELKGGRCHMSEANETYLTMREAVEVVRVSEAAMRERWRRLKLLLTRLGHNVLIARTDLMALLRGQVVR